MNQSNLINCGKRAHCCAVLIMHCRNWAHIMRSCCRRTVVCAGHVLWSTGRCVHCVLITRSAATSTTTTINRPDENHWQCRHWARVHYAPANTISHLHRADCNQQKKNQCSKTNFWRRSATEWIVEHRYYEHQSNNRFGTGNYAD